MPPLLARCVFESLCAAPRPSESASPAKDRAHQFTHVSQWDANRMTPFEKAVRWSSTVVRRREEPPAKYVPILARSRSGMTQGPDMGIRYSCRSVDARPQEHHAPSSPGTRVHCTYCKCDSTWVRLPEATCAHPHPRTQRASMRRTAHCGRMTSRRLAGDSNAVN